MMIQLNLNGETRALECAPDDSLMDTLRRARCWSVKHGCETGECGSCSVLLDGALAPTCILLAAQADGHTIVTTESLTVGHEVHPIQQAFIETGAIQCGYCTPAMVLAAKALLQTEPSPTEAQAREAIGGVLCRCTGYLRPVEAILRAAAVLRGEPVPPIEGQGIPFEAVFGRPPTEPPVVSLSNEPDHPDQLGGTRTLPKVALSLMVAEAPPQTDVVGHPEPKVDAVKLAKGKPVFADDIELPGMLYAALLTSPHAHARIRRIDASRARALPGVHAVLTHHDVPRVVYASGGQSWPNPKPWDQVSLDSKVRHVGDRVAVVAAESLKIAREALKLIDVDYEVLPCVFDPADAMRPSAPQIHDEPDAVGVADAARNMALRARADVGNVDQGLAESDYVLERTYHVHQVQQAAIEPHIVVTYWDEDERLVIRTSTQVPFHVRRMIAPLLGLPVKRIRVIKPRIGGGFGGKQEMLIEDLCAHLTLATGRPVRFEYTRELEFTSARSRHPQTVTYRAGLMRDGTLHALDMRVVEDTGAYGTHGLTVCTVSGLRGLSTYRCPHMRFIGEIFYTNKPTPGAFRGYGAPQAEFALESLMEEIAHQFGFDPLAFRLQNAVRVGDPLPLAKALGEAREGFEQIIASCALSECVAQAASAIGWPRRADPQWHRDPARPHVRRGLGMAACMHGTGIAGLDMGGASIKMNDDGSFNILVGGTDLGTGSDTVLAQIGAETLGVPLSDVIIYSSDTDFTPFDKGAYASSTTYISGGAVKKAAEQVRAQIFARAALMLKTTGEGMVLRDRQVAAPDGRRVPLADIALHSLHTEEQQQIMASASHMSYQSPPPFGAQFAEVEVDTQTGLVTVKKLVMAVDCGTAINPHTASGQIEGGMVQALGYALCEEMPYDESGRLLTTRFADYHIFQADETPPLQAILVPTYEPSGPYGAKAVAEIPMDGVAPAIANAVVDAVGVRVRDLPITPEKVWRALQTSTRERVSA
ncbi:MAG: molybdopterin-dependent oxidoreductase [Chloroflexi bacterium]|nr:molybdopterin-dependent oxidoreductase [Chloroflexota bacterium]